jgi:hypothetical protein
MTGVAYWSEFVQTTKEGRPTSFWATKPHLMLAKCAEAIALRKAFPQVLSGAYVPEEMGDEPLSPVAPVRAQVERGEDAPKPGDEPLSPVAPVRAQVERGEDAPKPVAEIESTSETRPTIDEHVARIRGASSADDLREIVQSLSRTERAALAHLIWIRKVELCESVDDLERLREDASKHINTFRVLTAVLEAATRRQRELEQFDTADTANIQV